LEAALAVFAASQAKKLAKIDNLLKPAPDHFKKWETDKDPFKWPDWRKSIMRAINNATDRLKDMPPTVPVEQKWDKIYDYYERVAQIEQEAQEILKDMGW